jgi:putative ABC transport system substrate-binding protein
MKRREFIAALGGAAGWPLAAYGQQAPIPLVGLLYASGAAASARFLDAFRGGMLELGYAEGSTIRYEYRFADGYLDRLPDLAIDLVRLRPDVIVSAPLPSHIALRQATNTIPIVMATGADPVGFGLVTSLSHPGGNVTGLANFAELLAAKAARIDPAPFAAGCSRQCHEPSARAAVARNKCCRCREWNRFDATGN